MANVLMWMYNKKPEPPIRSPGPDELTASGY